MEDRGVLAMSLNGRLRIRELGRFGKGVVELSDGRGGWTWCVWHACDMAQAWSLFESQCRFHLEPHPYLHAYICALELMMLGLEPTSALREVGREVLGLPWGERLGDFVIYGTRRIEAP